MAKLDKNATQILSSNVSEKITPAKVKNSKTLAKPVMLASGGILAGVGVNELINNNSEEEGEEKEVEVTAEEEVEKDVSDDENDENTSSIEVEIIETVNTQNFSDAFAEARNELGAGGVFEWNGNLYNTYYAEEWEKLNEEEVNTFVEDVTTAVEEQVVDTPIDIPNEVVIVTPVEVVEVVVPVVIVEEDTLNPTIVPETIEGEVVEPTTNVPVIQVENNGNNEVVEPTLISHDIPVEEPVNPQPPVNPITEEDTPDIDNTADDVEEWNDFIAQEEEEQANLDDNPDFDNEADMGDFA